MAALNLTPDFTLVAGQAVLFLGNVFVVSKLWVEPYLGLRRKQKAFTVDVQAKAEVALAECQSKLVDLALQVQTEREALRLWLDQEKQKNLLAEKEQIEQSRREAAVLVERFRVELRGHLQEEKKAIPRFVSELSQQCMTAVLRG